MPKHPDQKLAEWFNLVLKVDANVLDSDRRFCVVDALMEGVSRRDAALAQEPRT